MSGKYWEISESNSGKRIHDEWFQFSSLLQHTHKSDLRLISITTWTTCISEENNEEVVGKAETSLLNGKYPQIHISKSEPQKPVKSKDRVNYCSNSTETLETRNGLHYKENGSSTEVLNPSMKHSYHSNGKLIISGVELTFNDDTTQGFGRKWQDF